MSSRDKSAMDNTYITTLSSQRGKLETSQEDDSQYDQGENRNTISEKDEDLEDLSCSQFIKQTEFSLNKEDMHSTSRFDSEYIHNALNEGLNNSINNSKEMDSQEEEDYMNDQSQDYDNIHQNFRKQQKEQLDDNYTPFSSFNRNMGMNSNQQFEGHSLNLSLLNQQQMHSQNEYMNEVFILKNTNYALEQENARLSEEITFLKKQHLTNQDLIRMQTEYQQIKFDEKIQDALRIQRDKYEGKINNYKEQIKMYQTSIENIRSQYKDKNQKLYEIVVKLEKEKQELMDRNIDLIKTKIQNKLVEENNLNNSQSLFSNQKQSQNVNNSTLNFNSNSMLNNTLNLVNESFENLNFTGSFSQQLASMKQNQKVSLEKLQDLKVDSICIQNQSNEQQRMDSFIISKPQDESFSQDYYQNIQNNTMRAPHQSQYYSNQKSTYDVKKDQQQSINQKQLEQNINTNSSKNRFQLTRLSKQIQQDDEANISVSNQINNKQYQDDEFYQDKIKKSLHQGENLLKNNLTTNLGKKSEYPSPNSSINNLSFSKNFYEKRSYSIDSNVLKDLSKSYNILREEKQEQICDSSVSRVKQYQDYLINENEIQRKRNISSGNSRKNSMSDSIDTSTIMYLGNQKPLKNNFLKSQNTITLQTNNSTINSEKNKRRGSNSQRNASFSYTSQTFNKENNQINANTENKSSYMKQTQSSKQKKAMYKPPDHLAYTLPAKVTKSSSVEKKPKSKQIVVTSSIPQQQKKQFPIYSKVKNLNQV